MTTECTFVLARQHTLTVIALLAVTALAALAHGAWIDFRATELRAENWVADIARVLEEHTNHVLAVSRDLLAAADAGPLSDTAPLIESALHAQSQSLRIDSIRVLDAGGRVIAAVPAAGGGGLDPTIHESFTAHRDGAPLLVGGLVREPVTGTLVFTVSRRIERGGAFAGVIAATIPAVALTEFYRTLDLGPEGMVGLVRTDGAVVARHPLAETPVGTVLPADSPLMRAIGSQPSGRLRATAHLDGVDRQMAFSRLKDFPVAVVVGVGRRRVMGEWVDRQMWVALLLTPLALLLVALGRHAMCSLSREEAAARALSAALAEKDRLLADKMMLLSEVHHRVKNNLQIIQSLLTMEALRTSDEFRRGYDDSLQRIQAMGMIHELLYQSGDFSGISAGDYVERLCRLLLGGDRSIVFSMDAETVHLDLDRAIPFAMAVNEIVSNALKHGFAGGRAGRLAAELRSSGGAITLTVTDDGAGLPPGFDPGRVSSLGVRLLTGLARQLGGGVSFETLAGTRVRLSFPADDPGGTPAPAAQ